MTGIDASRGSANCSRRKAMPSVFDISRSRRMRQGTSPSRKRRRASLPSPAVTTLWPTSSNISPTALQMTDHRPQSRRDHGDQSGPPSTDLMPPAPQRACHSVPLARSSSAGMCLSDWGLNASCRSRFWEGRAPNRLDPQHRTFLVVHRHPVAFRAVFHAPPRNRLGIWLKSICSVRPVSLRPRNASTSPASKYSLLEVGTAASTLRAKCPRSSESGGQRRARI